MEWDKKKKRIYIMLGIVSLLIILMGSTYAFFTYSKGVDAFVLTSKGIKASFEAGTNSVSFTNAYPISDAYAMSHLDKLTYIDFSVSGSIEDPDQAISYQIYLTEETGNTLNSDFVKVYLTDLKNNSITNPKTYGSLAYTSYQGDANGKVIYEENVPGTFTKNYRLYVWLDSSYEQNTVSQTFTFKVNLYAYNNENKSVTKAIQASIEAATCNPTIVEDEITYLSGTNACIDFNYVWYSGKLWRITAIYPDGSMKMVTDDAITSIRYGSDVNFYTDATTSTDMYQWLNEDFLDTLHNYENVIVTDSKWNATNSNATSTSAINEKLPETTMVPAPVGLLNSYEYYMSSKNTTYSEGYLNVGYYWRLLNPYSSSGVWLVKNDGSVSNGIPSFYTYGVRPSIQLKSTIQLTGGTGSKENPYRIMGDKEEATVNTTLLNTRTSGEYVTFDGELYRIVSVENGITKINKNDYIKDETGTVITKNFSSSVTFGSGTSDTYFDYYLNNTWYNSISETYKSMLIEGTYYLGTTNGNYKGAICKTASNTVTTKDCVKTTSVWTGLIGLPRFGEMFASQQGSGSSSASSMWLMNPYSSLYMWAINVSGDVVDGTPSSNAYGARPSIYLKSTIKITGGTGLKENPFEIGE